MISLEILPDIYNTTLTLFFFLLSFLMFLITYRGYKNNKYGASSTFICGILFIIFGYYNTIKEFVYYPFDGFMVWWIGIILIIFLSFSLLIKRISNKIDSDNLNNDNKISLLMRYMILMRNESPYRNKISLKMEAIRKIFHLAGLLYILAVFGFFIMPPITSMINEGIIDFINQTESLYNILWGDIIDYPYSIGSAEAIKYITMFALIAILVFAIISELIRVLWGPEYSIFNLLTRSVLRNEEYNAVGPQIYLITGVIFSYLLFLEGYAHILTVSAGILIACFSDAAAALIGRKYGKHKVVCLRGQEKSVEGFIAGVGSAYLIGLFTVGPLYALIGATIFFLLDYFPTYIADNLLNPIIITIGITIFYNILGLPIRFF